MQIKERGWEKNKFHSNYRLALNIFWQNKLRIFEIHSTNILMIYNIISII